jgi:transcriptional regulator with XRE-family HTH domain
MSVAETLAQERRARGLSQPQMASLLGVSLRQYQRWEHGLSAPRERQLERIGAVLAAQERDVARDVAALRAELGHLRAQIAEARRELASLQRGTA